MAIMMLTMIFIIFPHAAFSSRRINQVLDTDRNADLIIMMNNGNIIESGTHHELLSQDVFYADLYSCQFEHST